MSVKQPPVPNWIKETISNLELSSLGKTVQGDYLKGIVNLRKEANCYNLIIDLQLLISFMSEGRTVGFELTLNGVRSAEESGLKLDEANCFIFNKNNISNVELLVPQTSSINEVISKGSLSLELPKEDGTNDTHNIRLSHLASLFVMDEDGNDYLISSISGLAINTIMYDPISIGKATDTVLH